MTDQTHPLSPGTDSPRRWTVYEHEGLLGNLLREVYPGLPNEGDPHGIAVMPVSEHERLLEHSTVAIHREIGRAERACTVTDEMAERAWDAYCDARDAGVDEPVAVMRRTLLAALSGENQ